jgi:hypothetical protein
MKRGEIRWYAFRPPDPMPSAVGAAGHAYTEGRLSNDEVAAVFGMGLPDAIALLEQQGFRRTVEGLRLTAEKRAERLRTIREERIARAGAASPRAEWGARGYREPAYRGHRCASLAAVTSGASPTAFIGGLQPVHDRLVELLDHRQTGDGSQSDPRARRRLFSTNLRNRSTAAATPRALPWYASHCAAPQSHGATSRSPSLVRHRSGGDFARDLEE